MKHWKPIFIENSRIPVWLSKVAPIEIGAITLGFIVFSRNEMNVATKRHETIHFQQFLELFFIGFVVLYFYYWLKNLAFGMGRELSYFAIPFEREAYENDWNEDYLRDRKWYTWWKYRRIK